MNTSDSTRLHPLQVEAIAWAFGLKDVLSGCLSLAPIWFYLRAVAPGPTAMMTPLLAKIPARAPRWNRPAPSSDPAPPLDWREPPPRPADPRSKMPGASAPGIRLFCDLA
ncbi:MAG: hypothetical protein JWN40_5495 [Phycisphaerales bacterium]|nr:hypothetical protein [Phycisphaerales bacterium]